MKSEDREILTRLFGPRLDAPFAECQPTLKCALRVDVKSDTDATQAVSALLSVVVDSGIGAVPGGWSWSTRAGRGELVVWGLDFAPAAQELEAA